MANTPLDRLSELGQSIWIDNLSRESLRSGELEGLISDDAVVGVTSNPTIFQKAISSGSSYDEQLRDVLGEVSDPKEAFLALAIRDIQDACDLLRGTWERTRGRDGWVSLEVDPSLAFDAEETVAEASRLREMVGRDNLFVKIPATLPGLKAIEESIARGIPVNVTLIFSLQRYAEVAGAYLRGLERRIQDGREIGSLASVASFFVSRVDTEVDRRLEDLDGHEELRGKAAIANAKLAYQRYREIFAGARWQELAAAGATPQRCLWASTSTKNPQYRDIMYVEELIGPDTVNTMPPETIAAFQDHGQVELTLGRDVEEAERVLAALAQAGIDYDDVTDTLEREGVEKFADSFTALLEDVGRKRAALVPA